MLAHEHFICASIAAQRPALAGVLRSEQAAGIEPRRGRYAPFNASEHKASRSNLHFCAGGKVCAAGGDPECQERPPGGSALSCWSFVKPGLSAQAAKQTLLAAIPNAKSEHLAGVVAFDAWQHAVKAGGRDAASAFCSQHFHPTRCWDVMSFATDFRIACVRSQHVQRTFVSIC